MKNLVLIGLLLTACNYSLIRYPSKDIFQQNDLFCYYKNNGKWVVYGSREQCPENTFYDLNSPIDF